MRRRSPLPTLVLALPLLLAAPLGAQQRATAPPAPEVRDSLSVSTHVARIGGQEIRYTATAGTLVLRHPDRRPRAEMFFVSYAREGQAAASRPLTFSYNGGPGSPSIWLHMGVMGPKRVEMAAEGFQPAPPYRLVSNEHSLLDVTDIVMIDPVQTGYSRAVEGESAQQFHGVRPDIESVAEFIRLYLTKFERWESPKYLLGESYGTMRSAGLAEELQNVHGIELNGIVLVSSILDYQSKGYAPGNDLPYSNFLPTYAATAWYHRKLPPELQAKGLEAVVQEAREFAYGDYLLALAQGNQLPPRERREVAERVASYSGLSPEYVLRSNLRVPDARFRKELLRDQGLTVGRLDGRYTGLDADAAGERQEYDPSNSALAGPYTALFSNYVRSELGWETDLQYFTSGQVRPWDYSPFENRYLNLVESLRSAMARNPYLRVMVANGYYDFATPFSATEYTFRHLGYEPTYPERVELHYYEAGHMMYIHPEMLRRFKQDAARFIESAKAGVPMGRPTSSR